MNNKQARYTTATMTGAFTLAELLVSMAVLVILVFLATHLVSSAASVTILGHKRMDADSEARQVFDRMAVDFAQMLKRTDVDYYVKFANQQRNRNDQMAFYSAVPGYYPSSSNQSPLSLVAYRVNNDPNSPSYNKLERLAKGLVWNGVSATDTPIVFGGPYWPDPQSVITTLWPYAINQSSSDAAYEVIGPDVFRFEYYYLGNSGGLPSPLTDSPCYPTPCTAVNAWSQVTAIVVDIAVIDPRSKLLLTDQQIGSFNFNSSNTNFLLDFNTDLGKPGKLINFWQAKLNTIIGQQSLPRPAVSGIRVYERYFYLK